MRKNRLGRAKLVTTTTGQEAHRQTRSFFRSAFVSFLTTAQVPQGFALFTPVLCLSLLSHMAWAMSSSPQKIIDECKLAFQQNRVSLADLSAQGRFEGSEAQALEQGFSERLKGYPLRSTFISEKEVDVNQVPKKFLNIYQLKNLPETEVLVDELVALARTSGEKLEIFQDSAGNLELDDMDLGFIRSQDEVLYKKIAARVNQELVLHPSPVRTPKAHPQWQARGQGNLAPTMEALTQVIQGVVASLNESAATGTYLNPSHLQSAEKDIETRGFSRVAIANRLVSALGVVDGSGDESQSSVQTSSDLGLSEIVSGINFNSNAYDQDVFKRILKAIRKDDTQSFIVSLVEFITSIPQRDTAVESELIKDFSVLFLTKSFPSIGSRQAHFSHFLGNASAMTLRWDNSR